MPLEIRKAQPFDTNTMAQVVNAIIAVGGTTAYSGHFDEQRILKEFMPVKNRLSCFVVTEKEQLVGFQALVWSDPD